MSELATETLRRLLDERDVEYEVEREGKLSEAVLWDGPIGTKHSAFVSNENPDKATGEILYATLFLTPEQAIAATLGEEKAGKKSPPEGGPGPCGQPSDAIIHEVEALGGGKLTAEQVREAVMSADRWEKPMGNTGLMNTHLIIRDDGWQAIANELNAVIGDGECENVSDPPEGFLCSACGWGDFDEPSHLLTTAKFTGNEHGPNFCPNCGRRAVKR